MPIYEFECRGCGHQFEYLQLRSSAAAECPVCAQTDLQQMVSLPSMSTEASRATNLGAAHRRAAGIRNEKQRAHHAHVHEHFQDTPVVGKGAKE